jgi:hypothetical protein
MMDMNIVNMIQTIQKLKAGLAVVIENGGPQMMREAKKLYLNNCVVCPDEDTQ